MPIRILRHLIPFLLAHGGTVHAQQAVPASGGDALSPAGSVSHTVGQAAWNAPESSAGRVSQGVQQTYDVTTVSVTEPIDPALMATVGPNPTDTDVTLWLAGIPPPGTTCQLLGASGQLVRTIPLRSSEETIPMDDLPAATYLLNLMEDGLPILVVKIVKH